MMITKCMFEMVLAALVEAISNNQSGMMQQSPSGVHRRCSWLPNHHLPAVILGVQSDITRCSAGANAASLVVPPRGGSGTFTASTGCFYNNAFTLIFVWPWQYASGF